MRLAIATSCAVLMAVMLLIGCGDDNFVNPAPGEVTVSGRVMANACVWFEPPFPYSQTGRQAIVRLINMNGDVYVAATDDSSRFSMVVDTGEYLVEIVSWHSWPIILTQTHFSEDTSFDPTFAFQFLMPDSVMIEFYYEVAADSLGEAAERSQIELLDGFVGGIEYAGARREVMPAGPNSVSVWYTVGTAPYRYVWQVCDDGNRAVRDYTGLFAQSMHVSPTLFVCALTNEQVNRPVLLSPEEAVQRIKEQLHATE